MVEAILYRNTSPYHQQPLPLLIRVLLPNGKEHGLKTLLQITPTRTTTPSHTNRGNRREKAKAKDKKKKPLLL